MKGKLALTTMNDNVYIEYHIVYILGEGWNGVLAREGVLDN